MALQHVLIATVTFSDADKVRRRVQAVFSRRLLKEDEDYVIVDCTTRETMREYLEAVDRSRDHVLVIAQPSLTDRDDLRTVLASILEEHPGSVILLVLNNVSSGWLRVAPGQIIRRLDERSLSRLEDLVAHYLKAQEIEDYNRLAGELNHYKRRWLSPLIRLDGADEADEGSSASDGAPDEDPDEDDEARPRNAQDGANSLPTPDMIEAKWNNLAERINAQARVSLDTAMQKSGSTSTRDTELLSVSAAFLHLWVESRLYARRARSNYQVYHNARKDLITNGTATTLERIPPGYGVNQSERAGMEKAVTGIINDYFRTLGRYDRDLRKHTHGSKYFTRTFGDAEHFRSWYEAFGPRQVKHEDEPGWDIHAASVSGLLYYQYRDAMRREYMLDRAQWLSAFLFLIYKIVTGFGLKPARSAMTALIILVFFAVSHAVDDQRTGCSGPPVLSGSPWAILRYIGYYLAVSVSSLTSLGSVATPCGTVHGLLIAVESICGYFLLAVLTTLFVQALLDR